MLTPNTRRDAAIGRREGGQILVLFSLMIVVLLMFVMAVVDVGFFLHERAVAQQTADAAALAASQELPGDAVTAEAVARDYVERNGMDPAAVDISFRCTTQVTTICTTGSGTYDTIVVTPHGQAPSFFGGILKLVGAGDLCWVDGCGVQALAAACRGSCGPIGNAPVDVVVALDHSGSMTTTDLANAKSSIETLFTDFNDEYQTVGLTVTPPVKTTNHCDSIEFWTQDYTWLSAPLDDNFQTSPHVLDDFSPPVQYSQCVERGGPSGVHTNLGSPLQAATTELVANGRPDVTHGIIMLTDGAANIAPTVTTTTTTTVAGDTGWNACDPDSEAPVTSGSGDNNGFQNDRNDACNNGSGAADDDNSGTSSSTSCTSTAKDRHDFWEFNLPGDIPSAATITGFQVKLDAWANSATTRNICVDYSTNSGSSWTSFGTISLSGTSEQSYVLGTSANLSGLGWTESNFGDSNFKLRLTMVSNLTTTDFDLDLVAVKVHYTEEDTSSTTTFDGSLGPCDWAVQQANAAKAAGIEVYIIGWGVSAYDSCSRDLVTSPYYNMDAADFLALLATDAEHFFNEPKSEDLDPIFSAIGSSLSSGSRLIE